MSRIAVNVEETLLLAATQDGCIFVFDVRDKVTVARTAHALGKQVAQC